MQRFREQVKYLPRTFALVWSAARRWTLGWITLAVVEGLLPVATVYLTRSLVNALVAAVRTAGAAREMRNVLLLGSVMAAIMLASRLLRSAKSWVGEAQAELVRERISALIHAKSAEADLQFYDSPEFYDHLHRAREEARYRPIQLLENLGNLLQNGITFIAMIAILIPYGPILPLALVVSTLPALYFVLRSSERRHRLARATTIDERRTWYFDWLLTSGEAAQELRLFGLAGHFQDTYQAIRRNLRERKLRLALQQTVSEIWTGLLSLVVVAAALLYMLWKTIRGMLSLGDLALFYQAFNQGLSLSQGLLGSVGQLYENTLFLGNLFEFLDFESKVKDPATPMPVPQEVPQIAFKNVFFRYPGTEKFALRDLNLAIPSGKIVAIVGPNGSGKSTILKLLCRFYDPESGIVELDGIPLSEFSREKLRERISALFQVPVRYNATARENIIYGNLAGSPLNQVEQAARKAAAESIIDNLPERYDSHLGRWFSEGSELSVGEWQRLALARALFRNAPILVLDEPTSAMDPWAELDWSKRFRGIAAGRTAIVITHRFTTAMFTDRIFVMRDGQVCEEGTHQELLDRGGVYASGWALQQEESR
jgi:ATP-binding cassette subfamily B protein